MPGAEPPDQRDPTDPADPADLDAQINAVAALNEPLRRGLYRFAASQPDAISRDQAAQQLGISRELAAFHLDKLVDLGLLDVEFRRLSGRQGPGAGRPAKLYRPSGRQLEVSFPNRRYDLAAHLLAKAMEPRDDDTSGRIVEAARQFGEDLGRQARKHLGRRPGVDRLLGQVATVLEGYGFEPIRCDGEILLRNCPFGSVAAAHPEVVCGMNLAVLEGVIDGMRTQAIEARLSPESGRCCVIVTTTDGETGRPKARWPRSRLGG
jgi:predicted ArsR family transcriptional regulator